MTRFVVSGASGSLGGKIAARLLEKVPAETVARGEQNYGVTTLFGGLADQ